MAVEGSVHASRGLSRHKRTRAPPAACEAARGAFARFPVSACVCGRTLESELSDGGFFISVLVVAAVAQVAPLLRFSAGPLAAAGRVHLENE